MSIDDLTLDDKKEIISFICDVLRDELSLSQKSRKDQLELLQGGEGRRGEDSEGYGAEETVIQTNLKRYDERISTIQDKLYGLKNYKPIEVSDEVVPGAFVRVAEENIETTYFLAPIHFEKKETTVKDEKVVIIGHTSVIGKTLKGHGVDDDYVVKSYNLDKHREGVILDIK